jgi:hypothetical protein
MLITNHILLMVKLQEMYLLLNTIQGFLIIGEIHFT